MKVTIYPGRILGKQAYAPPSKSMAHRELICAGLAEGRSIIRNIAASEDILATMDCLRALGAEIVYEPDEMTASVSGARPSERPETEMPCRESGSTMRFMVPICAISDQPVSLSGSRRLLERPMTVYEDLFRRQGIEFARSGDSLRICGKLRCGEFCIPGDISSQFVSGLMFALPMCKGSSVIKLTGDIQSRPYIDMTIRALAGHGVRAEWQDGSEIVVPGQQEYAAADTTVEGDWSNAAYLMATGADVTGLDPESLQGDKICTDYFKKLDAGYAELDISDCPDLGPVLMARAAMRSGAKLTGTERLKYKESDRGLAMKEELAKFGVGVSISDDSIEIGSGLSAPCEIISGHNDHRIVMAVSALCIRTGGVIDGAEAVSKSFPDFFDRLSELGIKIKKEN